MKKETIFSLFLFSILFLIPIKVSADSKSVNIEAKEVWHYYGNNLYSTGTIQTLPAGNHKTYKFIFNTNDNNFMSSSAINFNISENLDFSNYENMLISVYGKPILSVFSGTPCTPVVSNLSMFYNSVAHTEEEYFLSTYSCPVPSSQNLWFEFNYTNDNFSAYLFIPNYITLIPKNTSTEQISSAINNQTEEIQSSINDMKDMDMNDSDKEMPDSSSYQDYSTSEKDLLDKTKDVNLDTLDVGIDTKSSSWIWDTLTRLIQSHSAIFGMFIGILTIGIIKLILGR